MFRLSRKLQTSENLQFIIQIEGYEGEIYTLYTNIIHQAASILIKINNYELTIPTIWFKHYFILLRLGLPIKIEVKSQRPNYFH